MSSAHIVRRQSLEYQESHLGDNHTRNLGGFYIVLVLVAASSVILRLISRSITQLGLLRDDWTFVGGSTIAIGSFIVLLIYAFDAGLGEHWVALTPDQKTLFPKLNYAYNILNVSCYPIIKLSILLFYLRIFISPRFRRLCWAGFYNQTIKATCINDVQFYWATAILNVLTDLYILVLPMPMVWRLHATFKKKLAISAVFMLGGLTFVVSIIRIVYYLDYTAEDPSYSFLGTAYSTPAEVCLGIMVASAPTWRPVWSYSAYMTSSIVSKMKGSHESFNFGTAHSQARSVAFAESVNTEPEGRVELAELATKGDVSMVQRHERTSGEELHNVPSAVPSTAPSLPQVKTPFEPAHLV
ncbi:MAG: hypothetical protein M1820_010425 [Bogoriella megaspora]|nr:MAG: hypothetical protein M1820_010425 [Bogoriella megaspora]